MKDLEYYKKLAGVAVSAYSRGNEQEDEQRLEDIAKANSINELDNIISIESLEEFA